MKNNISRVRLFADILLFLAVLVFPWWAVSLLAIGGIFFFRNFYESFFAGFLLDALYGTTIANAHGFRLFFSSGALLVILIAETLKSKVRR